MRHQHVIDADRVQAWLFQDQIQPGPLDRAVAQIGIGQIEFDPSPRILSF